MGVLGPTGRGLAEAAGVEADVDFIVGTFSKSLGSVGGFCVSDVEGFDLLRIVSPALHVHRLPATQRDRLDRPRPWRACGPSRGCAAG